MAIYHFSVSNISRNKGQSATASAAYRSGEKIYSERYGKYNCYHREIKPESFILKPNNAPDWVMDREKLWNEVEKIERSKNARLAKEIVVALPVELNKEEQNNLAIEFCQKNFADHGMVSDINIHRDDENNPHFHVMITTRPFNEKGEWGRKSKKEYILDENGNYTYTKSGYKRSRKIDLIDCNSDTILRKWRKSWADIANEYLRRNGINKRISEKSYKDLGLEKIPTIHEGYKARRMGDESERIKYNKVVRKYNDNVKKINDYKKEIKDVKKIQNITRHFSPKEKSQLAKIAKELKAYVNLDTVIKKDIQLSHWEKSEMFKSKFNRENIDNLNEIKSQKELVEKANNVLLRESNRFIDKNYKSFSKGFILSDFQKLYITDLSVKKKKILNEDEFKDAVYMSSRKEFYESIKKITRDPFKSYLDLGKKLKGYENDLKDIVKRYRVNFKNKRSVEKLNDKQLNKLKLATVRVNNTKQAIKFVKNHINQRIDEVYPSIAKKLHSKLNIHEKEIVLSSYDYYERPLTYKEIKNIKVNPPQKYDDSEKKEAVNILSKMNSLKKMINDSQKSDGHSNHSLIRRFTGLKYELHNKFPEIFGEKGNASKEQFFYSELRSVSKENENIVNEFLFNVESDGGNNRSDEYYQMRDYRKTGPINKLLSSGFTNVNRALSELDFQEREKITEMNRLQRKQAYRKKRGLSR